MTSPRETKKRGDLHRFTQTPKHAQVLAILIASSTAGTYTWFLYGNRLFFSSIILAWASAPPSQLTQTLIYGEREKPTAGRKTITK